MHLDIVNMIIANIYNHPLQWCSTVPQVPTSIWYLFYTHTHMQSHIARTQTDRVLRILRTTTRAIRQTDRAEPLLPLACSMAAPGSVQGERSLKMCSLTHRDPNLRGVMRPTPSARRGEATAGRSDRCCEHMHAAHRAATTAGPREIDSRISAAPPMCERPEAR